MAAVLIRHTGRMEMYLPANGTDYTLEELQKAVGGYIEIVKLRTEHVLVLNEDGKLEGLPHNAIASAYLLLAGRNDVAVGDVLLCDSSMIK